ncbi:hypothetical protein MB901379_02477 [Mycobacterium basiliense]|uniref:Uncharacterized protein n=1 Tax=Mycobacterium basiliense TaxID=2094119 RepID=A0A447GEH7_9MYCO|nr:hypothetical protein MB901379_02477 [Mycobacterium basiliense]
MPFAITDPETIGRPATRLRWTSTLVATPDKANEVANEVSASTATQFRAQRGVHPGEDGLELGCGDIRCEDGFAPAVTEAAGASSAS